MAKTIIQEITDIVKAEIEKAITPVIIPDSIEVTLTNPPETPQINFDGLEKALAVFAQSKKEVVSKPDFSKIENLLNGILNLKQSDNSEVLERLIKAVESNKPEPIDFSELLEGTRQTVEGINKIVEKPNPSYRGGAIGPSKHSILDKTGKAINPATKESTQQQKTAFGELSVVEPTPIVQIQFPYNINTQLIEERTNGGALTVDSNRAKLSTGASANQSAEMLSIVPIKYNPGQGGLIRFTALFTTGVANSTQYVGVGDTSDGYFFGYSGTTFGILRRQGGAPEVRTLTITTKSTTAEDITITLDGDAATDVTVSDATSTDTTTTANEIASHDYSGLGTGWRAHAMGSTVRFESYDAASHSGTFSLTSASTAVGSFAQNIVGAVPTETIVAQTAWSDDKMDGTGPSGVTLDTTKGNVYQIQYQWLGYGQVRFFIERDTDGEFELVHTIDYANANTIPSVDNPTLPLCAQVKNTSNTSDIVVHIGSMAGFIEGKEMQGTVRHGTSVEKASIGTSEVPVLTIHNPVIYQSSVNRVRSQLAFIEVAVDGTKPSTIRFRLNPTLTAGSFSDVNTNGTPMRVDTSATAVSGGNLQFSSGLAKADSRVFELSETTFRLGPRDFLTISAEASSGTLDVVVSINWVDLF